MSQDLSVDPGSGCVPDLRIPVATVVPTVVEGQTHEEIDGEFPKFALEDTREAFALRV